MKAFTGKVTKDKLLEHMYQHKKADSFKAGQYANHSDTDEFYSLVYPESYSKPYKEFKGCAVGCAINSINLELDLEFGMNNSNHLGCSGILGIPVDLIELQDKMFEILSSLSKEEGVDFAIEFFEAINIGADLTGFNTSKYLDSIKYIGSSAVATMLLSDLRRVK